MKKVFLTIAHIGYWGIYVLLICVIIFMYQANAPILLLSRFATIISIFCITPALIGFYGSYLYVFPTYLQTKKWLPLIISALVLAIISALGGALMLSIVLGKKIMFADGYASATAETFTMALIALVHIVIALVFRGFIQWLMDTQHKKNLELKNRDMELALLKSQINPHFLFNTIQNIDVLIHKDANAASNYLLQLSDMLRFMLYESANQTLPLSKEINYMQQYIALQQLRTSNETFVQLKTNIVDANMQIAPMLFVPFLENAFKYADNKKIEQAIQIQLNQSNDGITFCCINKKAATTSTENKYNGLGEQLMRQRLALLYPTTHQLIIENNTDLYKITLHINAH
jgi:two-component system, LytTR family, sensor kinase